MAKHRRIDAIAPRDAPEATLGSPVVSELFEELEYAVTVVPFSSVSVVKVSPPDDRAWTLLDSCLNETHMSFTWCRAS